MQAGDVEEDDRMHAEIEKFYQQQPDAQVLVERIRTDPRDMQEPDADASHRHQRDHPRLPGHHQGDQTHQRAEYRGDDSQQQMPARLFSGVHCFSNS